MREGRRQTVVKMNFDAANQEEPPDKSFQSSSESIVVEERLSIQSNSVKSMISSTKSTSALHRGTASRTGALESTGQRKLSSAK